MLYLSHYHDNIVFSQKIVPVFGRADTQPFLDITAEIRHGREIHTLRDFRQRKFFLPEQTGDFLHRESVNPVRGRFPAYLFAYFRQIVGRDTEA